MLSGVTAMLRANLWLVGVCSLAVGLIIFLMARNFARVLKGEAGFVAYVAEGNLTIPPDMRKLLAKDCARSDEIGMLARGIRHMVDRIRALFDEAKQKTDEAEQATAEARRAMDEAEDARESGGKRPQGRHAGRRRTVGEHGGHYFLRLHRTFSPD